MANPAVAVVSSTPFEHTYARDVRCVAFASPAVLRPSGLLGAAHASSGSSWADPTPADPMQLDQTWHQTLLPNMASAYRDVYPTGSSSMSAVWGVGRIGASPPACRSTLCTAVRANSSRTGLRERCSDL